MVTGVDGFTGRYLAPLLKDHGHEVHGLVTRTCHEAAPWDAHVGDLVDATRVHQIVRSVAPDFVVHLAGVSFVAHGDAESVYRTNLIGTRHLLEALASLPRRPAAVLLASSANVYGNSTKGVISEDTPPDPANDYAVSKLAMEYLSHLYANRLPIIIARPFNYTGVGQSETFLLPKIVAHTRRRARFIELGNIEVARDFSDVRMVVEAYRRLISTPAAIGGTYNICSGRAFTLHEVLAMVEEVSMHRMEVRVNRTLARTNEVRVLLGTRDRLESVVGALPLYKLKDTLRWMFEASAPS
ncbi:MULTISPECIES: GDP-mannose 4,6-dehydratase [Cyanobium]|uniref:GDP-mannose 4,6-dehydratase n=1 Tax=Cyanobium TaxID=167375 RepID=UPI0019D470F6|nr:MULTISPECIES: GDP-mannose 4,6-dehydratase [Cyanobium]MCP9780693.1 GDP-mannose 4,6-dehydratase [Cyanobium sp. To12R1]